MSVYAPNPKTLLSYVPPSHTDCVRSFTLIPAEECIPFDRIFGKIRAIPTWCIVTKRGRYNGDLGYMISFNAQSGLCDLLVASRDLRPHPRCDKDDLIGMDPHARRLFSPENYAGTRSASLQGHPTFRFRGHRYVAGLLLIQLPETQVRPFPTPTPHQMELHVKAQINPRFVNDTRKRYNQRFWKTPDHVVVNDASHFDLRAILMSVDLQNCSAIVEPLLEGGVLIVPLASLERIYRVGDHVRIIADPCSDLQNVHHRNIGKFGLVAEVDSLTGEATFLDTNHSLVGFSSYLLLDGACLATRSSDSRSLLPSRIIFSRSTHFRANESTPRGKPRRCRNWRHRPGNFWPS